MSPIIKAHLLAEVAAELHERALARYIDLADELVAAHAAVERTELIMYEAVAALAEARGKVRLELLEARRRADLGDEEDDGLERAGGDNIRIASEGCAA